jgi:UDP-N-acetylglucosamine diphosphorylase/glucosamine-1-phosphate N-acetyltransferase
MPILQACVLAAGKGTRMGGDRPKVLFEANGKPLIEWVLGALSDAGVDDCVVVVGFRKEEVVAKLPTGVRWAEQSPQLGTGHAVRCARDSFPGLADDLVVTYGDMPLVSPGTYRGLVALRRQRDADAVVLTVPIPPDSRFGRVVRDADGGVRAIVEYKDATPEQRAITEGNAGVYCFRPEAMWPALDLLKNDNAQGEYYLTDLVEILLAKGGRVVSMLSGVPGEELGVNTPEDLELAAEALRARGKRKGQS